jgi:hypothetical protein
MWRVPDLTRLFPERMDDILAFYTEPLPKGDAVHCFDVRPEDPRCGPAGVAEIF